MGTSSRKRRAVVGRSVLPVFRRSSRPGSQNGFATSDSIFHGVHGSQVQTGSVCRFSSTPALDFEFAQLYQGFVWTIKLRKLSYKYRRERKEKVVSRR